MESAKTPLQIRLTPEVLSKLDRYRQQFPFPPGRADVALKALDDWLDRQAQTPVDAPAPEVPTPSILPVAEDVTSAPAPRTGARVPPAAGRPSAAHKGQVLARVAVWQREGLTINAMAQRLNEEGLPTLSGSGGWNRAALSKLLLRAKEA